MATYERNACYTGLCARCHPSAYACCNYYNDHYDNYALTSRNLTVHRLGTHLREPNLIPDNAPTLRRLPDYILHLRRVRLRLWISTSFPYVPSSSTTEPRPAAVSNHGPLRVHHDPTPHRLHGPRHVSLSAHPFGSGVKFQSLETHAVSMEHLRLSDIDGFWAWLRFVLSDEFLDLHSSRSTATSISNWLRWTPTLYFLSTSWFLRLRQANFPRMRSVRESLRCHWRDTSIPFVCSSIIGLTTTVSLCFPWAGV